jgi:HlyD family secretion protein
MLVLLVVLVPASVLIGAAAYRSTSPSPEGPAAPVESLTRWVQGVGYVEPVSEVRRLSFKGNGVIAECRVGVGDLVARGAMIMRLKNEEEQAAVALAEKELAVAQASRARVLAGAHPDEIEAARHTVALLKEKAAHTRKEAERYRRLSVTRAASDEDRERSDTNEVQAAASLREAEARLRHLLNLVRKEDRDAAKAEVRLAEARLEWRRRQLADTILTAPCAGRVLELVKREGDAVRLADNEPAVLFGDVDRLRVRAEIEDRFARRVREGQRAVLFGRGLGQETCDGKVVFVKGIMGKKTVFSRSATERKDLDVLQVFVEPETTFRAPVGLQVDLEIAVAE